MGRLIDVRATAGSIAEMAEDVADLGHTRGIVHLHDGVSVEYDARRPVRGERTPSVLAECVGRYQSAVVEVESFDRPGIVAAAEEAARLARRYRHQARLQIVAEQERICRALYTMAVARRAEVAREARLGGMTGDEVGSWLGVTKQRVGALIATRGAADGVHRTRTAELGDRWGIWGIPDLPVDMDECRDLAARQREREEDRRAAIEGLEPELHG